MNKKRIVVFGCTGMVGAGVSAALNGKCDLVLVARDKNKLIQLFEEYGPFENAETFVFEDFINKDPIEFEDALGHNIDMVINCIGVLNRTPSGDSISAKSYHNVNIKWPHILSEQYGDTVVHISTDCVFDGKNGPYSEDAPTSPSYEMYGYSKLFGESISDKSLVLRCCLIGESIGENGTGLLDWARKQEDRAIKGFYKCFVSAITSVELGKICLQICNDSNIWRPGLRHIEADKHCKYEILSEYRKIRKLKYFLLHDDSVSSDKSLITCKSPALKASPLTQMLQELVDLHKEIK